MGFPRETQEKLKAVDRDTRHGGQFSPRSQGKPSAENEQNARKAETGTRKVA